MNNGPKYFMVGGVGKLMIFYGRILVSGLITLLFYGYISLNIMIKNNIFEPILLLLVMIFIYIGYFCCLLWGLWVVYECIWCDN